MTRDEAAEDLRQMRYNAELLRKSDDERASAGLALLEMWADRLKAAIDCYDAGEFIDAEAA